MMKILRQIYFANRSSRGLITNIYKFAFDISSEQKQKQVLTIFLYLLLKKIEKLSRTKERKTRAATIVKNRSH